MTNNLTVIQEAVKKADEILEENSVVSPPVRINEIIENYGLKALESSFSDPEIAGVIDVEREKIYVNKDHSPTRKIFTIAHELGHWILHRNELTDELGKYAILYRKPMGEVNDDPIEKQANAFAAHLLVPKKFLKKYYEEIKRNNISAIAEIFGVSHELIGYRIKQEELNV